MGKYKLIVGNPGDYNNWYRIAKSNSFCPIYDENETGSDEDIFIYESLNNIVRNAKGTGICEINFFMNLSNASDNH